MLITQSKEVRPALVAHRGYSRKYPENTLLAMRKAFEYGACYVECDVQLTADKVPVVIHDSDLQRISGRPGTVHQLTYEELCAYSASYPERFGKSFCDERIPKLDEFVDLLKQWPQRVLFVEFKRASIRNFGIDIVLGQILPLLEKVNEQVILISFDEQIIRHLIAQNVWKTGWIVEEWTNETLQKAKDIGPDYFFVDFECLPSGFNDFQSVSFEWVLYEIDDPQIACKFVQQGVNFIETNDIKSMLQSEKFSGSGCS